ncbi:effector-associated constant component EACC1 [Nocardia anaemiae]|uniref:effector-associated constant component EACC1 n=1 Tax=Nocardia anaemiae TaxID=263910 RepID=UPI0007A45BC4|nr:hypothetical protein [Nocardia anaemiae]
MEVRIQLAGDNAAAALVELKQWLSREDELSGRLSAVTRAPLPGQMGGITDVLIVVLGAQGAGAALVSSLSVWIRHRRPSVEIELTNSDGRSAKLSLRDTPPSEVSEIIRQIVEHERN